MLAVDRCDCQQCGAKMPADGTARRWGAPATIQGPVASRIAGKKRARIPGENARPGSTQPGKTAQSVIRGFCRSTGVEARHPCRWANHVWPLAIWEYADSVGLG